ncbi:MAG TPA: ATP-binding protein, partial [Egibacteraceae bacterium]|nr:ATP-binding protein [Egibacteraceae bacterium]
ADDDDVLALPLRSGRLLLWAGPHTPYFGREELDLLARFGVVIDLAWVRCELLERQRETTVRLEEAQRIARLGAWEMDLGSGAIVWSAEMYRIFDIAEGSPVTLETFTERLHPEDLDVVMAEMARTIEGGPADASMDYRIVLPDGTVRTVHGQGQVQAGADGRPARLVGTAHDITDRKAAEDALNSAYERERTARLAYERANDELESFVYSVSHDLKSPIISLLGYLDYLRLDYGSLLPPEAGHYLDRMTSSAGYMEALIQDLLELSRIGRVQTDPEVVDLGALVADIAAELCAAHPAASVAVDPLPSVLVNPVRARQLFTNLIGNALDHAGRGDVHVRVHAEPAAGGAVAVLVTDDGRGIPDAYREKVFGVFERLDSPGDPAGTGIGLAICRKVMDALGGSIAVDDVPQGTRMRLEFPASAVAGARTGAVAP